MLFALKHTAFHHRARQTVALLPFGVLTELVMNFGSFVYKDEHQRSQRNIPRHYRESRISFLMSYFVISLKKLYFPLPNHGLACPGAEMPKHETHIKLSK